MRSRPPRCTPWASRPATAGGRPPPSRWWPTGRPSTACSGSSAAPAAAPRAPATAGCWSSAAPWPRSAATSPTPNPTWSPRPSPPPSPWPCWPCWKASRATPARSPAWPPRPLTGDRAGALEPARPAPAGHDRPTRRPHRQPGRRGGGTRRPAASAARRARTDRQRHGRGAAAGRLCPAAAGRPALDGPHPGRGRRLWPQQRRQLPATPTPTGCGAHPVSRPQLAAARRRPWLCLPRHPGPAPALPPPPPRRPPAGSRRPPSLRWQGRLLVSGSGLRPGRQAPPGQPGPPRGQGRHLQPGPGPGLVDPPPPGQHRPGHRPPLRRPGRRRPRRRPGHPDAGRRPWPAELRAAGPHRRGWLALLPGPHRPRQRPPGRAGACGLAGPGRLCGRPTQPPRLRPPLPVGRRPRPRHPAGRGPGSVAGAAGTPTASSDQPARSSFRPPATARVTAMRGRPWPRSWPGSPPPRSASATASCGSRPATSTTWSPPAPSTTARSTKGSWRPPNAAASSPRSPARPTAPWPRAARSAWPTPAAHAQPTSPERTHLAVAAAAGGRRANQGEEVMAMAAAGHPAG